ncbi:ribosome maturation factor RimM [Gordonia polyisoprenivorans VH2]|uniref:Ribosome maturation factor RimM n=1 Tax=Gordonia polyisoprenivorans (strain DSM 44266 / VH2) TaxID=1112204 RepID=H6MXZ6_GORPV|nr:ribosome maturation factor RimM [Gordonia polyisoprenivorans]AFA73028.1 ribosome maturation factor RimM [Gordonia polyisoprenivorans VH2]QUD80849.1 ribosome maturation factor RimM [Gordonia polyisoprenivorans]HCS56028.1 ribosome maturation factor RimM [Gordonia polyisoprenivorans]
MELVVGRVAKSHGIRGELVVDVRTDEPQERFARGTTLLGRLPRGAGERTFTVTAAREHSGRLLLSLGEVTDRSAADALRGTLFLIDSSEVDSGDDPDAFYDHELEGVAVSTIDGVAVGVVGSVLHLPANDILVVRTDADREVLVPFVREIVPTVTLDGIEIDPPPGLIDDAAADAGGDDDANGSAQ